MKPAWRPIYTPWACVPSSSPAKGPPGPARQAVEHRRSFRAVVEWRIGCEGRIAHLKRRSGWDRTLLDGLTGARTWCGHGVFAHNLTKISGLAA